MRTFLLKCLLGAVFCTVLLIVVIATKMHPGLVLLWRGLLVLFGWTLLLLVLWHNVERRSLGERIGMVILAAIFSVLFLLGLEGDEKGPWDRP